MQSGRDTQYFPTTTTCPTMHAPDWVEEHVKIVSRPEPTTPKKRVLTEEAHDASNIPRSPSNGIISDDLAKRLANVGARVRKCVTEGYTTQRAGFASSPTPSPFSSPSKAASTSALRQQGKNNPIFRSASDTLIDVYGSPGRPAADNAQHSLPSTPSKKRRRGEDEDETEESSERVQNSEYATQKYGLMDLDACADDEDDETRTSSPSPSPVRRVKPLKRTSTANSGNTI